jgi:2'-hydroxyisoflavone reductase
MRILVLGGGRFQGRRAAEMLVAQGHAVTVFNRGAAPVTGAAGVRGERSDLALLKAVIDDGGFDSVIDNIAYSSRDVVDLLPLLAGKVGRYILVSSFMVYVGAAHSYHLVREEEAAPVAATGDTCDAHKRGCEAILLRGEPGVTWTILRPCQIHGPGDPSNRRGFFVDRVADGGGLLVPSGCASPFQPLWRDDAARAAVLAATHPTDGDRIYNVAGGEILSLDEWLDLIAGALGVAPPYIVQLPRDELRRLAGFDYRLPLPMRPLLCTERIRLELGFVPTPAASWLPETVAWWRKSGLASRFWEHREAEVTVIRRLRAQLDAAAAPCQNET